MNENDIIFKNLLGRTFFNGWKNPDDERLQNFRRLEITWDYKCNLRCTYCYYHKFGEQLFVDSDDETKLDNLRMLLQWLKQNDYKPEIEFFSGEPLIKPAVFTALKMIIDFMKEYGGQITIPTNFTWIKNMRILGEVDGLMEYGKRNGVEVLLSASVDGKFEDVNRPGVERDDDYYNKVFNFAWKHQCGFHPMIYSENIEKWKENFLWFQEMLRKNNLPWNNIYLLEIRNEEWNDKQIKEFGKFIEFLVEWTWVKCGRNFERYYDFLIRGKGFNILNSILSTIGRGIGCGYQSMLYVRMGDLTIVPCHRTSYRPYISGGFIVEDKKIIDIYSGNIEYYIAGLSMDADTFPYCETCVIKNMCSHGCLGSQLESTGDPFTPIPSVCKLEFEKVAAMIRVYRKLDINELIMARLMPEKRNTYKYLEGIIKS